MPEGDSIHRLAARLRPILRDQMLVEVEADLASVDEWGLVGRTVVGIEARGKNLLIHCAPKTGHAKPDPRVPEQLPVVIWTHLGMHGAWRVHERSSTSRWGAKIALHSATHVAACVRPKQLALLGPRRLLRHPMLARLGPDLLDADADLGEAVTRLRALVGLELGVALMRQSAVAGIGNVYKSELLFLARRSPFVAVDAVDPGVLLGLLERGRALMRANVDAGGARRTRGGDERLWVYERSGRPCLVCGTTIEMVRQGEQVRSTYFCPRCQGS